MLNDNKEMIVVMIFVAFAIVFSKTLLPRILNFYADPVQCEKWMDGDGYKEYCLNDDMTVPINCYLIEEKSKSFECHALNKLKKNNKKEVSFNIFGHSITIKAPPLKSE